MVTSALLAAAALSGHFPYGVAAGEVSAHGARLWTRADGPGKVVLHVGRRSFGLTAGTADDLTVQRVVGGLKPGTAYTYWFTQGGHRSPRGHFRTAPAPGRNATIRFAFSGDADALGNYNGFQVYGRMAGERNAFNINLGDTIYSDSEVPGAAPALTVADKWAKYRQNLAPANLRRLRAAGTVYNHWDDHEFLNDYSRDELGGTIYDAGVQAFRDYMPVTFRPASGIYRTFRWGRNLELFFLDERSFRSAKASANHVCDNPDTHQPDLAPAAPQRIRDFFGIIEPSFRQPTPPACLAALNDPARTMLGAAQLATFERAIRRSTATWKVIVNEVPIQQLYALPYDRWEGYEAERVKLVHFLQANVPNAVFLTTDHHANLANTVRYTTLEDSGVSDSGIWDFATGPVATRTFAKEIDDTLGKPGTANLVRSAFFKPPPPNGIGMRCAALDTYSYAEVKVDARRFRIAFKDLAGRPVKEPEGKTCGPFTLNARRQLRARRSALRSGHRAGPAARRP